MSNQMDLVNLANMASRLNDQFGDHLETPVAQLTPYDWWKRTKESTITEPLPKPVTMIAGRPVFRFQDVASWFIRYRGIGVR